MIRQPVVAGYFYPGEPAALRREMEALIPGGIKAVSARGVVVPHAGYLYSGAVAGKTLASVQVPETVILMGPNHTGMGEQIACYLKGSWDIPGASIPVDQKTVEALLKASPLFEEDITAHQGEHSLEVQLPFLYARNQDVSIAPVCLGHLDLETCLELGKAVSRVVRESSKKILIVASSDMTHYEPDAGAREKDAKAIEKMVNVDPEGLYHTVADYRISMCGVIPATVMLAACRELGAAKGTEVVYATSGDASGDYSQVVGYAGVRIGD